MNQLFQFDGKLYEQIDGVAMGSRLGPFMTNEFLCSVEETLYVKITRVSMIVMLWHIPLIVTYFT